MSGNEKPEPELPPKKRATVGNGGEQVGVVAAALAIAATPPPHSRSSKWPASGSSLVSMNPFEPIPVSPFASLEPGELMPPNQRILHGHEAVRAHQSVAQPSPSRGSGGAEAAPSSAPSASSSHVAAGGAGGGGGGGGKGVTPANNSGMGGGGAAASAAAAPTHLPTQGEINEKNKAKTAGIEAASAALDPDTDACLRLADIPAPPPAKDEQEEYVGQTVIEAFATALSAEELGLVPSVGENEVNIRHALNAVATKTVDNSSGARAGSGGGGASGGGGGASGGAGGPGEPGGGRARTRALEIVAEGFFSEGPRDPCLALLLNDIGGVEEEELPEAVEAALVTAQVKKIMPRMITRSRTRESASGGGGGGGGGGAAADEDDHALPILPYQAEIIKAWVRRRLQAVELAAAAADDAAREAASDMANGAADYAIKNINATVSAGGAAGGAAGEAAGPVIPDGFRRASARIKRTLDEGQRVINALIEEVRSLVTPAAAPAARAAPSVASSRITAISIYFADTYAVRFDDGRSSPNGKKLLEGERTESGLDSTRTQMNIVHDIDYDDRRLGSDMATLYFGAKCWICGCYTTSDDCEYEHIIPFRDALCKGLIYTDGCNNSTAHKVCRQSIGEPSHRYCNSVIKSQLRLYTNNGRSDYRNITPDYMKIYNMLKDCWDKQYDTNSCPEYLKAYLAGFRRGNLTNPTDFIRARLAIVAKRVNRVCRIIQYCCDPEKSKAMIRRLRTWETNYPNGWTIKNCINSELMSENSPLQPPMGDDIGIQYNPDAKFYNNYVRMARAGAGAAAGAGNLIMYGVHVIENFIDRKPRMGKGSFSGGSQRPSNATGPPGGYYRKRISRKNRINRNTRKHRSSNRNTRKRSNRRTRRH